MPRQRKTDLDLPSRVYKKHGAYHYVDFNNRWIRLDASKDVAIAKYYQLAGSLARLTSMSDVIDRYMREFSPTKAQSTYKSEISASKNLRAAFGHIPPDQVKTTMVYEYLDVRSETAPIRANREIALLSHIFKKARRWGVVEINPVTGVERNPEKPRDRYVTDEEFSAFKSVCPRWLQLYCELKYLTAFRKTDMLNLKWSQISEAGINIKVSKTQNKIMMLNSEALSETLDEIKRLKRPIAGLNVFHTKRGQQYTSDGFRSIFYRYIQKAIKKGLITEPFREPDIRAKSASDAESLATASGLLDHADGKVTRRHYRRKATEIKPLK